jgi:hypothetical protein
VIPADGVWDNQVFNLNAYLNDVLITYEGDFPGAYQACMCHVALVWTDASDGYAHGTHIIPLKANLRFDGRLCMGHNGGPQHQIAIQVIGFITA